MANPKRIHPLIWLTIIILATVIVYANSWQNPFIWDQEVVILGNPLIRNWNNLPYVFRTNVEGRRLSNIGFYRPMEVISYMIDYTFWKFNPFGYHLSSILLHLGNALLLFWFLQKIKIKTEVSFLTCLIFAIHPVNTETVTYSIRGDLVGALFSLLCFLAFSYGLSSETEKQQKGYLWRGFLMVCTYILALLSKESMVMVPGIVWAYLILFRQLSKRGLYLALALSLISCIYVFIRYTFIFTGIHQPLSLISDASLWERILTLPRIILTYIRLLVFPWHLHMEYHFVERSPTSPYVWLGIPALIIMTYGFFRYIKVMSKLEPELKRNFLLFLAWFLVGLSPFYNIVIPLHATITEHWLYFPGMGFIAVTVSIGFRAFHKAGLGLKKAILAGLVILLGYYGLYTIRRNWEWGEAMRLYQHDLKYEPNSFILHNNVGVIYFRRGDFKEAKEKFLEAIRVSPKRKYEVAYNNLGAIYENEGDFKAAEEAYKTSIELNNYELAYGNLSRLYLRLGKIKEAIQIGVKGRELYPLNAEINHYLALGYHYDEQLRGKIFPLPQQQDDGKIYL